MTSASVVLGPVCTGVLAPSPIAVSGVSRSRRGRRSHRSNQPASWHRLRTPLARLFCTIVSRNDTAGPGCELRPWPRRGRSVRSRPCQTKSDQSLAKSRASSRCERMSGTGVGNLWRFLDSCQVGMGSRHQPRAEKLTSRKRLFLDNGARRLPGRQLQLLPSSIGSGSAARPAACSINGDGRGEGGWLGCSPCRPAQIRRS